jgi:uncharacterized SAM-binding protein YcdF (DUF218 family)
MFFISSKLLWAIIAPSSLVVWLICLNAGLFAIKRNRAGARLFLFNVAIFIIIGCTSLIGHIAYKWDSQHPLIMNISDEVEGVIILGGAIEIGETLDQGRMVLNPRNHDRIIALSHLLQEHPSKSFIYTGGNASVSSPLKDQAESVLARDYMQSIYTGNKDDLLFETQSKNTHQNAVMSKQLYQAQIDSNWPNQKPWLLLTSGYHMPRAYAAFKAQGWNVIAYPASHAEKPAPYWRLTTKFWDNWMKIDVLAHEIVGIVAYRLTNKI